MPSELTGADLLERTYVALRLNEGRLLRPSQVPLAGARSDWQSVGDWLSLASRMDADRLYFVGDDPVLVFSTLPSAASEVEYIRAYRQAWSLTRPRCIFIATPEELRVYALNAPPPATTEDWHSITPLEVVERTADVAEALRAFDRERVESGEAFEPLQVSAARDLRADTQLVKDISQVADLLVSHSLEPSLAHSLIERVILVRYLEDRGVVTRDYLKEIAERNEEWWHQIVPRTETIAGAQSTFISCLGNLELTYAVFTALGAEFNGDLFQLSDHERAGVTLEHLQLLQALLSGDTSVEQQALFLWAYDFSVVPTSLISSMYEHFYHRGDVSDEKSTHYTPPELVEYVVSEVLTPERLASKPRICDPACGSGVFLVEAYRRIVRFEMALRGNRLRVDELRELLISRLAGIDVNAEAVRLAAFSLYLAYLNYQTAQDIRAAGPLPRLIYAEGNTTAVLVVADAFAPSHVSPDDWAVSDEREVVVAWSAPALLADAASLRTSGSMSRLRTLPWPLESFDVIVGNPPWDEPRGSMPRTLAEQWAADSSLAVGDRSPSQLFLWRALSLMSPSAEAGMLVAGSVFYNSRRTSREFRTSWLEHVRLKSAINFAQARRFFFSGAVAPFFFVHFHKSGQRGDNRFIYGTVRPTAALASTRSLAYAQVERRVVSQESFVRREYLWKVYGWGSRQDDALMSRLDLEPTLESILDRSAASPGYGFQLGKDPPSESLTKIPSLKTFEPWGRVRPEWLERPPLGVKREPDEALYHGLRLLIRRGVRVGFGPIARLESDPFAFRHTTFSVPLGGMPEWRGQLIFGILVSVLGRYRLFMTSGSWGVWHDSVLAGDILRLPVPEVSADMPEVQAVVNAVRSLQGWPNRRRSGPTPSTRVQVASLPGEPTALLPRLDESVFDLFHLTPSERDVVNDWCQYQLPGAGRPAVPLPVADDVSLETYARTFVEQWNSELRPEAMLEGADFSRRNGILAAVFRTCEGASEPRAQLATFADEATSLRFSRALDRLSRADGVGVARRVAVDGAIRAVGTDFMLVIKRDERRYWSASAAREDFEATFVQAVKRREW